MGEYSSKKCGQHEVRLDGTTLRVHRNSTAAWPNDPGYWVGSHEDLRDLLHLLHWAEERLRPTRMSEAPERWR